MRENLPDVFFVSVNNENMKKIQNSLSDLRISYMAQNIRDCLKSPYNKCFLCIKQNRAMFICHDWIRDFYMKDVNSPEVSLEKLIESSMMGIPIDYSFEEEIIPSSIAFCQGV